MISNKEPPNNFSSKLNCKKQTNTSPYFIRFSLIIYDYACYFNRNSALKSASSFLFRFEYFLSICFRFAQVHHCISCPVSWMSFLISSFTASLWIFLFQQLLFHLLTFFSWYTQHILFMPSDTQFFFLVHLY